GMAFAIAGNYVADLIEKEYPDTTGVFVKKRYNKTSTAPTNSESQDT
ncbi:9627_t:CDS:1, partial [Acaulospora morrowiae]